jgi:hypothetical protein
MGTVAPGRRRRRRFAMVSIAQEQVSKTNENSP